MEESGCGRECESFELFLQLDHTLEIPISAPVWKPVYQVSVLVIHGVSQVRGVFFLFITLLLSAHIHLVVVFPHSWISGLPGT